MHQTKSNKYLNGNFSRWIKCFKWNSLPSFNSLMNYIWLHCQHNQYDSVWNLLFCVNVIIVDVVDKNDLAYSISILTFSLVYDLCLYENTMCMCPHGMYLCSSLSVIAERGCKCVMAIDWSYQRILMRLGKTSRLFGVLIVIFLFINCS